MTIEHQQFDDMISAAHALADELAIVLRNAIVAGAIVYISYKLATFRGLPNVLITMGILTSPARINVRDFVPEEYFVYLTIFGVLGSILVTTGLHMTLTWPLAPDFSFDNIINVESIIFKVCFPLPMSYQPQQFL